MDEQPQVHEDTVVLVPGFLGFSVVGQFPYFADRVPAVLGALLRERLGREVSVVPASTVPAGRLRSRIDNLSAFLGKLRQWGAERFYLVGHSTGGVDAQLLLTESPFWGGAWPAETNGIRRKVKAVVTISAPHYGTSLLDSAAARFVAHPLSFKNVKGLVPLLEAAGPLAGLFGRDLPQVLSLTDVSALQFPDVVRFLDSVVRHHELLDELTPKFMTRLRATTKPDPAAKLTCFLSGADVRRETRKSDPFYAELNGFGHVDDASPGADVEENVRRIREAPATAWIHAVRTPVPQVGPGTNDGIVNTARQLIAEATLAAVVVADHADVLGHYDRFDLSSGKPMNTGVFRSGAGFGDDEFAELYRRVAATLAG